MVFAIHTEWMAAAFDPRSSQTTVRHFNNRSLRPRPALVQEVFTLKPFEVMQTSIRSGANIVDVQIPRQVITNVNSKEFKPVS